MVKCGLYMTNAETVGVKKHWNWKGGRKRDKDGYILVKKWSHPFHNTSGYVYEHRLVMEEILDRYLTQYEDVHHRNKIKDDNRPENLELFTHGGHTALENIIDMSNRVCHICGLKTTNTQMQKIGPRPDWRHIEGKLACVKCYNKRYHANRKTLNPGGQTSG